MGPHIKRWITGVIAAPVLFVIIFYGSEAVFSLLIVLSILGAITEYNRMVFGRGVSWEKGEGVVIALLIPLAVYLGDLKLVLTVITFSVSGAFVIFLLRIKDHHIDIAPVGKVVLGFMYIPLMISHFILLRHLENGKLWVFFILILVFSGDISAFYVGRIWGRRKLAPLISPGKTWAGAVGSFIGSVAGCILFARVFFHDLSPIHAITIGLGGSILGQLSDLCESLIKRASGAKDSGFMMPGHGGILDRLDSLIFTVPFVYYYYLFVLK
ncbi:MAG: phosphatidate cytidylyltransferase [Syntrophales bacterium]|nr:phosphatidate cytidylyltransferase [Syntrophales bacterium]